MTFPGFSRSTIFFNNKNKTIPVADTICDLPDNLEFHITKFSVAQYCVRTL